MALVLEAAAGTTAAAVALIVPELPKALAFTRTPLIVMVAPGLNSVEAAKNVITTTGWPFAPVTLKAVAAAQAEPPLVLHDTFVLPTATAKFTG